MRHAARAALLCGVCLATSPAFAITVRGSLTDAFSLTGALTEVSPAGQPLGTAGFTTTDFVVSFSAEARVAERGVVQGSRPTRHAAPVAGRTGGEDAFLGASLGSPLTTDGSVGGPSGSYFSTGGGAGAITLLFSRAQTALALLWGSVDAGNSLSFFRDGTLVGQVSGRDLPGAVGVRTDGSQGFGGSAYILVTDFGEGGFTSVVAGGESPSFEFAGVVALAEGGGAGADVAVPAPAAAALLGFGLFGLALVRRQGGRQAPRAA